MYLSYAQTSATKTFFHRGSNSSYRRFQSSACLSDLTDDEDAIHFNVMRDFARLENSRGFPSLELRTGLPLTCVQGATWLPAPSPPLPVNRSIPSFLSPLTRFTRCLHLISNWHGQVPLCGKSTIYMPGSSFSTYYFSSFVGNKLVFLGHEKEAVAEEECHLHLFHISLKVWMTKKSLKS